ncbi:hypothetical protein [Legionella sp. km772]|uniref:hypothetical protein n=1 Tax=Legionella sp. km772 TaxID=2498111 RepID=UPI000F8CD593|nr:hypothetical protein [Legionella sp. km772]RUR07216.1 hypothetical protein ELY15_12430 [Legionella sp. km772]
MSTGLSISRILLESAIAKLDNLLATRQAAKSLSQAEQLMNGGIFKVKQSSTSAEFEAITKLLTEAKTLLNHTDDFDEVEANSLREKMNKIT